jgi:hypothetical protein
MDRSFLVLFFKKEQDFFLKKEAKTFIHLFRAFARQRRALGRAFSNAMAMPYHG